jgi:hypothetical protein
MSTTDIESFEGTPLLLRLTPIQENLLEPMLEGRKGVGGKTWFPPEEMKEVNEKSRFPPEEMKEVNEKPRFPPEPILQESTARFVMFPIQNQEIWKMYKKQVDCFGARRRWICQRISLTGAN